MKKVILCLHGFMVHDRHDLAKFCTYVEQTHCFGEDTIAVPIKLYDRLQPNTSKPKEIYKTLKKHVQSYQEQGYEVILLSYSFSCAVASRIVHELQLKQAIFVAPSVRLIKTRLLGMHISNALKTIKLRFKHGKKAKKIMERTKTTGLISLSFHISLSMLQYRKYYKKIATKYLLLQGGKDTYCLQDDVMWFAKKTKSSQGQIRLYPNWTHFFIHDNEYFTCGPIDHIHYFLTGGL